MRRLFGGEVLALVTAIVLDVEYCANNQAWRTATRRERSDCGAIILAAVAPSLSEALASSDAIPSGGDIY
jgi:hypothetical protein